MFLTRKQQRFLQYTRNEMRNFRYLRIFQTHSIIQYRIKRRNLIFSIPIGLPLHSARNDRLSKRDGTIFD